MIDAIEILLGMVRAINHFSPDRDIRSLINEIERLLDQAEDDRLTEESALRQCGKLAMEHRQTLIWNAGIYPEVPVEEFIDELLDVVSADVIDRRYVLKRLYYASNFSEYIAWDYRTPEPEES